MNTRTIGAVIPSLGNPNFATTVETLQQELAKANYTLVLGCAASRAPELRAQLGRKMVERGIECLVLVGEAQPPALLDLLKSQRIPYLMIYTTGRIAGNTCIGFDN